MNRLALPLAFALVALSWSSPAAQSGDARFEIGAQLAATKSNEFDATDFGVGARFAWRPTTLIGAEAEIGFYPGDFPQTPAFSRNRVEGLFGVTVGPRLHRLRPFAKLRPGFVTFQEAPGPFACILIFPPPLSCTLASGKTVFALDIGGGIEVFPTERTFVRVDVGDRTVRYPAPVLDGNGRARDQAFSSHDFRFALGGGLRF
jgi:hypothetical protein